jgi:predicted metal-binding membrane protein
MRLEWPADGAQTWPLLPGCCWALMAVLFVAGVMNPLWVAAIAGLVLIEKIARVGPALGKLAGVALIAGGAWMLAKAL